MKKKYRQAKKFLKQEMATADELLESNPLNAHAKVMWISAYLRLEQLKRKRKEK